MSRWFRFYDEALDDPKVQLLTPELFKVWVNLLCVASKHDGAIVIDADLAFRLRCKPDRVRLMIDPLIEKGLIEERGDSFAPHNWDGRQYKSDATDPTAANRQKKYRNGKRNADRNATVTATVTQPVTVTATRADTEQRQNRIEDDEEKPSDPLISEESNKLADEIAIIAGHSLDFIPPSWFGASYTVQKWLAGGWPREIIVASVRQQMGRRNGDPPDRIEYFEKGIAAAIARQNKPLPIVKVIEGETINVTASAPENRSLSGFAREAAERAHERARGDSFRNESGGSSIRLLPGGKST